MGREYVKYFRPETGREEMLAWRRQKKQELRRYEAGVVPASMSSVLPGRRASATWCFVYLLLCGDRVKIGRAIDVPQRLRMLQAGSAEALTLLAAMPAHPQLEQALHTRFSHLRIRSTEWFRADDEILRFAKVARTGINPVALLFDDSLWNKAPNAPEGPEVGSGA